MGLCLTQKKGERVRIEGNGLILEVIVAEIIAEEGDKIAHVDVYYMQMPGRKPYMRSLVLGQPGEFRHLTRDILLGTRNDPHDKDSSTFRVNLDYTAPSEYKILREKLLGPQSR